MQTPAAFASIDDLKRTYKAVRFVEQRFNGLHLEDTPGSSHADPGPPNVMVLVSDPQPAEFPSSGGYYHGVFKVFGGGIIDLTGTPPLEDPEDVPCVIFDVDGAALTPGEVYSGFVVGETNTNVDTEEVAVAVVAVKAGGGADLNTQNVDGSDLNAATTDIRADQSTYIEVESVAAAPPTPAYQKLKINTDGLANDSTFVETVQGNLTLVPGGVNVVVQVCVTTTLTKQYSTVSGEEHLMTNVSASTSVSLKTINIPVLDQGGGLAAEECVAGNTDCCVPVIAVACCPSGVPATLTLTVSGGGGDHPATWDGTGWVTGLITIPGCGTVNLKLTCGGVDVLGFAVGNEISPAGDCVWATQIDGVSGTCDPFNVAVAGTFSGIGCSCTTKTLTWSVPA